MRAGRPSCCSATVEAAVGGGAQCTTAAGQNTVVDAGMHDQLGHGKPWVLHQHVEQAGSRHLHGSLVHHHPADILGVTEDHGG